MPGDFLQFEQQRILLGPGREQTTMLVRQSMVPASSDKRKQVIVLLPSLS